MVCSIWSMVFGIWYSLGLLDKIQNVDTVHAALVMDVRRLMLPS